MGKEKTQDAERRIGVRLSTEQHELVASAATQKGLTVSAYVRMAALEKANREILGHK